jgi:hypothetical protein
MKRSHIYKPLEEFLRDVSSSEISLSFKEVEEILGFRLPATAYGNDTWWTNNPTGHSQAKAWLAAGFERESVDRVAQMVVFRRSKAPLTRERKEVRGVSDMHRTFEPAPVTAKSPRRSPLFGCMKGTFTIEPGYDLTSPMFTDEEWKGIEKEMEEDWDQIEQGLKGKK